MLVSSFEDAAEIERALCKRKMLQQRNTAAKRLRELLFECYGEIEKARCRSKAVSGAHMNRFKDLTDTVRVDLDWKIFIQRLRADSGGKLRASALDVDGDADAVRGLGDELSAQLGQPVTIHHAAAVWSSSSKQKVNRRNSKEREPMRIADVFFSQRELPMLLDRLWHESVPFKKNSGVETEDIAHTRRSRSSSGGRADLEAPHAHSSAPSEPLRHHRSIPRSARAFPLLPASMLLSSSPAAWLFGGSETLSVQLYYCVEERVVRLRNQNAGTSASNAPEPAGSSTPSEVAAAVTDYIAAVYAGDESSDTMGRVLGELEAARFTVCHSESKHRQEYMMNRTGRKQSAADGVILSSPDVLTAVRDSPLYEVNSSSEYVAQASLHFAPASLQHLLETDGYADMNAQCLNASERSLLRKTYPPHYIRRSTLGNLYALVKPGAPVAEGARTEKHDLLNGKLVPLSKESMREIVAAYVVRSQLVATPTAMSALGLSLLPEGWEKGKDAASRGGFALLISPKTKCPPDGDAANKRPAAAIVSFTTQRADGDDDANAAAFSKTKTNPLGEHCHWRGCSAIGKVRYAADLQLDIKGGKGASTKLRVCPYHCSLILRVGPSSGGAQEILRHLPRKFTGAQKKSYHFFTRKASSSKQASIGNESSAAEDDDKIINASSLLTELLTRKLSATIRRLLQSSGRCSLR